MSEDVPLAAAAVFEAHRRRLAGLAYRMLGSVADAEDVVQDAFLRWQGADGGDIANHGAFLTRVVTRLCLDHLKSARMRRESYVGPWLPDPVLDGAVFGAETMDETAVDLSVALMLALERLSPLERAAFLLHDVFDMDFAEVATATGRSVEACRQLASRARRHVRAARPRFAVPAEEGMRIARAFQAASVSGDAAQLSALLAEDVVLTADGGGKVHAALNPIRGRERVVRFYAGLARKWPSPPAMRTVRISGLAGFVTQGGDGVLQTTALEIADRLIVAIHVVRNPDKLRHVTLL